MRMRIRSQAPAYALSYTLNGRKLWKTGFKKLGDVVAFRVSVKAETWEVMELFDGQYVSFRG